MTLLFLRQSFCVIQVWISFVFLKYFTNTCGLSLSFCNPNIQLYDIDMWNLCLLFMQKPTSSVSPIYQTSSTKVQPVQPQVLNSVPANHSLAVKESKQPTATVTELPGVDRAGSPTIGKPALPPKPPPPLIKTSTPPPPPRQNAYHLPQYHQPDTSPEDGGRTYYTTNDRPAQQKDVTLTPPLRIPNGTGPVKSNLGNSVDSSESDNSSSSTSMRSVFGNTK